MDWRAVVSGDEMVVLRWMRSSRARRPGVLRVLNSGIGRQFADALDAEADRWSDRTPGLVGAERSLERLDGWVSVSDVLDVVEDARLDCVRASESDRVASVLPELSKRG